jgi:hypothetical protein
VPLTLTHSPGTRRRTPHLLLHRPRVMKNSRTFFIFLLQRFSGARRLLWRPDSTIPKTFPKHIRRRLPFPFPCTALHTHTHKAQRRNQSTRGGAKTVKAPPSAPGACHIYDSLLHNHPRCGRGDILSFLFLVYKLLQRKLLQRPRRRPFVRHRLRVGLQRAPAGIPAVVIGVVFAR